MNHFASPIAPVVSRQPRPLHPRGRFLFLGLLAVTIFARAETAEPAKEINTSTGGMNHVVLVSGINQDPEQQRDKDQAINRLYRFFTGEGGLDPDGITVLTAPDSLVAHLGTTSARDQILDTVTSLVQRVGPTDRVLFYYIGQANIVNEMLRLNLPGPDLTHEELATALAPVNAGQFVIVLDCPGAGLATSVLTGPGRIFIAAARSDQPHSTHFSSYFVPALGNPSGDYDNDGRTSLLESFQMAAEGIDARYREQDLLKGETPLLEDDNDAEPSQSPWRYATTGKDGKLAATCFPAPYYDVVADANAPTESGGPRNEESP